MHYQFVHHFCLARIINNTGSLEQHSVIAFGKKSGLTAGRPSFGVARPMNGAVLPAAQQSASLQPQADYLGSADGGAQFPSLEDVALPIDGRVPQTAMEEAMTRLSDRANNAAPVDEGPQGFEASVHKIKEQVLPPCLSALTPKRRHHSTKKS